MNRRVEPQSILIESPSGLRTQFNSNGSLHRMDCGDVTLNLWIGGEMEGGPANLWLRRRRGAGWDVFPLLGPRSATRVRQGVEGSVIGEGRLGGLTYHVEVTLTKSASAWVWRVAVANDGEGADIDLIYTQDLALAPYAAIRTNEYYVSQYIDHTPLEHVERGVILASRQNQAVSGRHPWCVIGSLRRGVSFATDAVQIHGVSQREGAPPPGLARGLPGRRLQHEHSMAAIQDAPVRLGRGASVELGFCGLFLPDHPAATSRADLRLFDEVLALDMAKFSVRPEPVEGFRSSSALTEPRTAATASLFVHAQILVVEDLHEPQFVELFGAQRRHEERDGHDRLLSFFHGEDRHVVLRAKELRVQRPHGHLLRTGRALIVDETALTSTTWMNGVFHSMLTQGHVSINRFLSTTRTYLGLFRSHGLRVFVEIDSEWRLLDSPSAYEMSPSACRWIYRHAQGEIEVRSEAHGDPHALSLQIEIRAGAPARFLISHHVALNGDDGATKSVVRWTREGEGVAIYPAEGSELHARFPRGSFVIEPDDGTRFERVGGDEVLFADERSREQPYICVVTQAAREIGFRIVGRLLSDSVPRKTGEGAGGGMLARAHPALLLDRRSECRERMDAQERPPQAGQRTSLAAGLAIRPPESSPLACRVRQLADITPWFIHNALIHYLSPRGLDQFSGGGWGVRDVCQGPVELLLAFGETAPVRDLLLRVMRAQNPDGDWPQWFMFFERERTIRAGDSHGDIVYWPLLALAQYLLASGDASVLDELEPFHIPSPARAGEGEGGESASVWEHVRRALALIAGRVVRGTALAAYGHGDWNDSLQPANPAMREHMCSAWTVTLHHQTLTTLARALRATGRDDEAAHLEAQTPAIRNDFQRLLLIDDVLAGYALFENDGVRYLLHPRDDVSGVRYSSLAMIHAILEDVLTPEQAHAHLRLIERRLLGPDGLRLFDRPMRYHGGPQRFFQRAESATFFGREIGLMYMHAHLRYAQALAHVGDADRFFHALCQANPIGIRELVSQATLRQSNCYYSSSDAAFADRYEASEQYERVRNGDVALDGGWRVYSSGAGIATGLIVRRLLGIQQEHDALVIDPVMPASLDGLTASLRIYGRMVETEYRVREAGCGVSEVTLNGAAVPLEYEANPYRKGAARIAQDFLAAAPDGANRMLIMVG